MTFGRRVQFFRVGLGLLFLLLFHLLSDTLITDVPLTDLVRKGQEALDTVDNVTAYEQRFEKIKRELPDRGVVGYRAQTRQNGAEKVFIYRSGNVLVSMPVMESYWRTQYAVAPVIVDLREGHPLTIVNLREEVQLLRTEER
jgi:hypothetical protein